MREGITIKSYDLLYVQKNIKSIDSFAKKGYSTEKFITEYESYDRAELFYFIMFREICRLYANKLISKNLLISNRKRIISKYENFYLWDIISENHIERINELKSFIINNHCDYCSSLYNIANDCISSYKYTSIKRAKSRKNALLQVANYNYYNININNLYSHTEKFYFYVVKELLINKNKNLISEDYFKKEIEFINDKYNEYMQYDDANKLYNILERKIEGLTKGIVTSCCPTCKTEMFSFTGLKNK